MLDYRVFSVADNLNLIGLPGKLQTVRNHRIDQELLAYHRRLFTLENLWA